MKGKVVLKTVIVEKKDDINGSITKVTGILGNQEGI